jgi:DNA-binding IclR family transcriptional regulator
MSKPTHESTAMPQKRPAPPLERYVTVLEKIAAHPGVTAPDIAKLCSLPFPTTHRLLQGLRGVGLVMGGQNRTGFKLAPRLLRLLQTGADDSWIRITAQKILDQVAAHIGETSYLAKLVDDHVVSIAWAAPSNGVRGHVVPGLSQPLHAAACAKAILAYQPSAYVHSLLSDPLPKICVNTKTSVAEVVTELKTVAEQGYATCINENEMGVTAIACPVHIKDLGVIYSVGVMSLGTRVSTARLAEIATILKIAADDLGSGVSAGRNDQGA